MGPKYENWFECLLMVKPKLIIVEPPQEDNDTPLGIDVRGLDNYDTFLKEMFEGTSVEKDGTDFLEQAVEYWLEERDKIVAEVKEIPWDRVLSSYISTFMEGLTLKSTAKKNTDVLLHMMGFLKKILTKSEKEDILSAIEDYRNELIPLIVPVTLVRHQVKKHNIEYLLNQVYLNPHPKELMLRNHV